MANPSHPLGPAINPDPQTIKPGCRVGGLLSDELVTGAFILPPYPHPLLIPDQNPGYARLRDAYDDVANHIKALSPDLLLLYSTHWPSVIGHQIQARAEPEWTHVDPEWHELGSIPYKLQMDAAFGAAYENAGQARGLEMRTVDHHGFPIDTGCVVALKLLNLDIPASIVSCNMYADRAETIVLGKAARDALRTTGRRAIAIAITSFSNRVFAQRVAPADDRIHSLKDDEWNQKYLDFFARGRLEDASQLSRQFSAEANGDQKMKAIWWLNAVMGQHNHFDGKLLAYEPVNGAGCAVVSLTPTAKATDEAEFDEDDAQEYKGDRNVLGGTNPFERAQATGRDAYVATTKGQIEGLGAPASGEPAGAGNAPPIGSRSEGSMGPAASAAKAPASTSHSLVHATTAPKPVGAYPHARRVGDMLYLSGLGPRDPVTNSVPGGPVWDAMGAKQDYDISAQTEAVVANMKRVLAEAGATIGDVVDVTCYLIDMRRDFEGFNAVYGKHFGDVQAARTTLEINRLPTPIAVEFKVIARAN